MNLVYAGGRRETDPTWSQLNVNIKIIACFLAVEKVGEKIPYNSFLVNHKDMSNCCECSVSNFHIQHFLL